MVIPATRLRTQRLLKFIILQSPLSAKFQGTDPHPPTGHTPAIGAAVITSINAHEQGRLG
jgi:hypothetical protein